MQVKSNSIYFRTCKHLIKKHTQCPLINSLVVATIENHLGSKIFWFRVTVRSKRDRERGRERERMRGRDSEVEVEIEIVR